MAGQALGASGILGRLTRIDLLGWRAASTGVLLVALGIRVIGLGDLVLFGDSASSVFFAMQGWNGIAAATAVDSHPPGYYYLLRLSLDQIGWNELGARIPSLVPGTLLVAVVLAAGRRLAGPAAALAVGVLAAVSPALIVYSRQPRMYALLALLSLLLLVLAARPGRSVRRNAAICFLALAALFTHYFAVVAVLAAASLTLARQWRWGSFRDRLWERVSALWPFAAAGALWLPWLGYALGESLRHTERTIAGVPPQPSVLHFLGSLAVAVPVGTFLPLTASAGLALLWWLIVGACVVYARRWPGWPATAAILVTAGAAVIFLVQPAFGRPRFFIPLVPLLTLSLAVPLAALRPPLAVGALSALMAIALTGVALTFPVERGTLELEAIRLGEALRDARSDDVVILQPWWQAGYLRTRLDPPPRFLALRDLPEAGWPTLLAEHRQIWLVLSGVGRRDAAYPLEHWLDRRAYRVDEKTIGTLRAVRYVATADPPVPTPTELANGLTFAAAPAVREAVAGGPLPVLVQWEATQPFDERVVLFLHVRGLDGTGWAGRDEEPDAGARQHGRWAAGETLLDRRGLVVPVWTPPGVYRLIAGAYRRDDGNRIGAELDLGEVHVVRARSGGPPVAVFGGSLALDSAWLLPPDPVAARRTTIETVDGPQTLSAPVAARPGDVLSVVLRWRLLQPSPPLTAVVQLLDRDGRRVVQREQPPAGPADPIERWETGSLGAGRFDLALPAEMAPGRYRLVVELFEPNGSPLPVGGRKMLDLGWITIGD